MSDLMDPPRLIEADGVPAELQSLLDHAQGDVLGADAVGRVAAGVQAQLGGSGTPTDGSASPPTGDGGATGSSTGSSVVPSTPAGKLGAGVIVAALVGSGLWLASDRAAAPASVASSQATTVAVSAAPDTRAGDGSPSTGTTDDAVEKKPSQPGTGANPKNAPTTVGRSTPAPNAAATSKSSSADLIAEHQLLRSARAALANDPRRAYGLTQEHKRRFPQGMLTQEREVIAIEALARMGDGQAAGDRADQFSKDYPDSPHRDRVDGATSGKGGK
ncbi:MAG: hypothetical protein JRI68_12000 [Deltaproteobacteria bacterium]|nr:hypothetical protein [Deltaproteobacteria bacterium]